MCYLVRQHQAEAGRGSPVTPPSFHGLRPRGVGAAVAALVGGLALAAFVVPSSTPLLSAKEVAAPAPIAAKAVPVPVAAAIQPWSAPMDDGVPSAPDMVKAGIGPCQHDL